MCSANRRRRQTRLLRRHRHFNGRYHNFQNPNQQHPLHQGLRHDDDGHQELLSRHPSATVRIHENVAITLSRGNNPQAVDAWVHIEIQKGMYGLKQAGLLANQLLQTRLAPFGYYPARHTPGLWLHKTRPLSFTVVVDDFAVKYVGKQHTEHLRNALLQTYELTTDWTATVYSGMTLKWYYSKRTCDISMPGYVSNVLSKFQHDAPKHPQHTPSWYITPVYGAKTQYATKDETTRSLHNNVSQSKK
jgi:hypothetical protein